MQWTILSFLTLHAAAKVSRNWTACRQGALLVGEAVGEGAEELIGGVVLHQHPLAHGQRLCSGGCHDITLAGVDENLQTVVINILIVHMLADDADPPARCIHQQE